MGCRTTGWVVFLIMALISTSCKGEDCLLEKMRHAHAVHIQLITDPVSSHYCTNLPGWALTWSKDGPELATTSARCANNERTHAAFNIFNACEICILKARLLCLVARDRIYTLEY